MRPFSAARELLATITGVSNRTAEVIIAETGEDMSVFPTAGHFSSWAGTAPGANESAGRLKSTKTRPGNRYLKRALGTAARPNESPRRRGAFHPHLHLAQLTTGECHVGLGPDYYTRCQPLRSKDRAVQQLESLGY